MLNVVLPEWVPSANKGEKAILEGLRVSLGICGDYKLTVYSPPRHFRQDSTNAHGRYDVVTGTDLHQKVARTEKQSKMLLLGQFLWSWGRLYVYSLLTRCSRSLANWVFRDDLFRAMSGADLILAGHDGMLGPQQVHMVLACRIMGKPIALYGGGDDITGRQSYRVRKSLQLAVKHSLIYCVRDSGAQAFMLENGIANEDIHVIPDPAVLLEPCDPARVEQILEAEGVPRTFAKPLYGLIPAYGGIVARTSFSDAIDPDSKFHCRVQLWKGIVESLLKNTDAHIVFLPHCIGPLPRNDDRIMNRAIYDALESNRERCTIIDTEYMAAELKGIIRACQYCTGERTHALIGAVSVGTPCVALSVKEDLRMHWIIKGEFGRPVFDLNNPDAGQIEKALLAEWECRSQTRLKMSSQAADIKRRAIEAAHLLKSGVDSAVRPLKPGQCVNREQVSGGGIGRLATLVMSALGNDAIFFG